MAGKTLDSNFEKILNSFIAFANRVGDALRGNGGPPNEELNQDGPDTEGPDRYDVADIIKTFSREQLTARYNEARTVTKPDSKEGTVPEVIAIMRQFDFLSSVQRDYMWQKASRIQVEGLAAARKKYQGQKDVSAFDIGIRNDLQGLLKRAGQVERPVGDS